MLDPIMSNIFDKTVLLRAGSDVVLSRQNDF
jgi:hypothetical protein